MRSNKGRPSSSTRHGMLPYHVLRHPRLRQIVYARLLSTPDRSTSELLRTLLNEWLLPSQHPSCLCDPTSLVQLNDHLGPLAGGLDSSLLLGHGPLAPALTPLNIYRAFGVYLDLIGGEALASNQSLYLTIYYKEAAPKCISGSTSYLRV